MRHFLIGALLVCGGITASAQESDNPATAAVAADSTETYETKHYYYLEFPRLLWTAAVHPLGQFIIYAEHGELQERITDLFTNADRSFGFFPYAKLGGETGTGGGFSTFHTDLFGTGKKFQAQFVYAGAGQTEVRP